MAYTNMTQPAAVLNREITATRSFFAALGGKLYGGMMYLAETSALNARARRASALFEKSDAELAAMNLKREDIVRRVFGDAHIL